MKIIKKLIHRIIAWAHRDSIGSFFVEKQKGKSRDADQCSDIGSGVPTITLIVYRASGGQVVRFEMYDPDKEDYRSKLYVITDQKDLGEELSMIITRESLSR